ncbi:hypothetical protein [Rhodovibrio salinarum]|uniref:Uncharacterized protein n=1 Tax=Rhodovibrio salinarum TaxID=1087 RepID=A0A934QMH2_9PROT|nr:hypothetical protein [Rhodovibrio salinarum]MBK1699242.1 hypothetical protein [Rhodovibrio salinarum]
MFLKPHIQTDFSEKDIIYEAMGDIVQEFVVAAEWGEGPEGTPKVGKLHLMSVSLIDMTHELPGGDPDVQSLYDLRFGLVEKEVDNDFIVSAPAFDRETANRIISEDDRPVVLSLILKATRQLVRTANADAITMSTFDVHLPERALTKYRRISDVVCGIGYRLHDSYVDDQGRSRWVFVREKIALSSVRT